MKIHTSILCLLPLLPLSCASDSGNSANRPGLSQRLNERDGYKQDSEGNWLAKSNKRSPFENQGQSAYFKGGYAKKDYNTGEYSKKSWWGNKDYKSKEYSGNTDGGRFQKTSRHDGKSSREAGKSAGLDTAYKTDGYATNSAREMGTERIQKPSDAETDVRRRVYTAPEIIDWRQQRTLSLEQSRGILGR